MQFFIQQGNAMVGLFRMLVYFRHLLILVVRPCVLVDRQRKLGSFSGQVSTSRSKRHVNTTHNRNINQNSWSICA